MSRPATASSEKGKDRPSTSEKDRPPTSEENEREKFLKKLPDIAKPILTASTDLDVKGLRKLLEANPPMEALNFKNNGGNTPLLMATIGTKAPLVKEIVSLLINAQADVNETNKQGYTALMNAAKRNYADTIELLIEAGADIRFALPASEKGPSMIALDMTKDKICGAILREAEAKRAAYERSVVSAEQGRQLMSILRSGDRKALAALLATKLNFEAFSHRDPEDEDYMNSIDYATNISDFQLLLLLLQAGADGTTVLHKLCGMPRLPSYPNSKHSRAKEQGRFGSLKYMTEAGVVNINVRDSNTGYTALMISSFMGYTEDVSILLAADADPTLEGKQGETALTLAAKKGHVDVIKLLLPAAIPKPKPAAEETSQISSTRPVEKPTSSEKKSRAGSKTPLSKKFSSSSLLGWGKKNEKTGPPGGEIPPLSLRQILCDHADKAGMTALMWAAANGSLSVTAELLKYTTDDDDGEIDINYASKPLRYTALIHAIDKGHEDVALFLLSKGASPCCTLLNGGTALGLACRKKLSISFIQTLMVKGADPNSRTADGLTALHWAALNGNHELCKAMAILGSNPLITDSHHRTATDVTQTVETRIMLAEVSKAYTK